MTGYRHGVRRFSPRQIGAFLWSVANRDASIAGLARKHGFTRADFRRWQATYGMPLIRREPTPTQLAALGSWRRERSRARAWKVFVRAARAVDDNAEIAAFDGSRPDVFERVRLNALATPRALVVCEKHVLMVLLDDMKSLKKPSLSHAKRLSLATIPWLPSRQAVEIVTTYARHARIPIAFFGDLDPQGIHTFAALRAGGREELLRSSRHRVDVRWIGLDAAWFNWCDRNVRELRSVAITMTAVDREYWACLQHVVPDVRQLIGRRASEFLDGGAKIEVDGLMVRHRDAFLREMSRRVGSLSKR